jgi:hypothetical protein
MATPFDSIFQRFLNKVTDSQLASLPTENLESIMTEFLQSAIVRFRKCKQDLKNFDLNTQQFNADLTLEEIEILSLWMVYEWLNQQINRIELLKQSLSSKDYAMYSQANHLQALTSLRQITQNDVYTLMKYYSYDNNDLTGLVGNGN